jgi:microcystin-dependent protein
MKRIVSLLATLCLFQSSHAATAVPDAISYQGRALTATGALMGAGTPVNRTVIFRIWDHASNSLEANLIYSEQQVVTIAEGEFSVLVGTGAATAGTPLTYSETTKGPPTVKISDAFGGVTRYLGVTIDDGTAAVDNEISPRQQIVSGAFALRSKVAESVDGLAITTAMLANNAVTTTQVSDAAITTSKLADNAVTTTQITDATITGAKIATDTIVAGNIAPGAVGTSEILDGAVATADIANLAVTTAKIADINVTTAKLADSAVTSAKIADGVVTGTDIAAATISLSNLIAAVQQSLVPAGTIVAYGGTAAPAGWLLCNGASVTRTTYPSLFTAIGTAFGTASTTVFNVPDFRGRFLRGWDAAAGRDPDRATRTAMTTGGNAGDAIGSIQGHMFQSHAHGSSFFSTGYSASYNTAQEVLSTGARNNGLVPVPTTLTGGNETRPLNANVNYIIKY